MARPEYLGPRITIILPRDCHRDISYVHFFLKFNNSSWKDLPL